MEGYEKYASRIQELLFDGMDVHEVWVYMKVMFQIEKNEICFRAYLERSGLIWFAEAGSRRQVKVPDPVSYTHLDVYKRQIQTK